MLRILEDDTSFRKIDVNDKFFAMYSRNSNKLVVYNYSDIKSKLSIFEKRSSGHLSLSDINYKEVYLEDEIENVKIYQEFIFVCHKAYYYKISAITGKKISKIIFPDVSAVFPIANRMFIISDSTSKAFVLKSQKKKNRKSKNTNACVEEDIKNNEIEMFNRTDKLNTPCTSLNEQNMSDQSSICNQKTLEYPKILRKLDNILAIDLTFASSHIALGKNQSVVEQLSNTNRMEYQSIDPHFYKIINPCICKEIGSGYFVLLNNERIKILKKYEDIVYDEEVKVFCEEDMRINCTIDISSCLFSIRDRKVYILHGRNIFGIDLYMDVDKIVEIDETTEKSREIAGSVDKKSKLQLRNVENEQIESKAAEYVKIGKVIKFDVIHKLIILLDDNYDLFVITKGHRLLEKISNVYDYSYVECFNHLFILSNSKITIYDMSTKVDFEFVLVKENVVYNEKEDEFDESNTHISFW